MSATISSCGNYRYLLSRPCEVVHPETGTALFVMLNPSTADAEKDDATIRRCRAFARSWSAAGIAVANLYAYRSTNPKALLTCTDPVGPDNNAWLRRLAYEYDDAVFAWGANASHERADEVYRIFKNEGVRVWCFGKTKNGSPRHPLYVPASQELERWEPAQ